MEGRSDPDPRVAREAMLSFFGLIDQDVPDCKPCPEDVTPDPLPLSAAIAAIVRANPRFVWLQDDAYRPDIDLSIQKVRADRVAAERQGRDLSDTEIYLEAFRAASMPGATREQVLYFDIISALMGGTKNGNLVK